MPPSEIPFWKHIEELRGCLVHALAALFLGMLAVYPFSGRILDFLVIPVDRVVFTSPFAPLAARVQVAFIGGTCAAAPYIFWRFWHFMSSGLVAGERRRVLVFLPLSVGLFLGGAAFAVKVILPLSLTFLLGFATERLLPMITIDRYMGFVGGMILTVAAAFEMPLVLVFLTRLGWVSLEGLRGRRREVFAGIMLLGAVLTPPDAVSMICVAVPLYALYELGILCAAWRFRR